jgi:hypothetical protein
MIYFTVLYIHLNEIMIIITMLMMDDDHHYNDLHFHYHLHYLYYHYYYYYHHYLHYHLHYYYYYYYFIFILHVICRYVSTRLTRDHNIRVPLEQMRIEQDHVGEANLFRYLFPFFSSL